MTKLDELVTIIKGKSVVIQTHNFPDPDAIATAFGLQYLLKTRDIDTNIVYFGNFDKVTLKRMTEQLHITATNAEEHIGSGDDYIINVDGQKFSANFSDLTGHEIACIDHHPWVTTYDYTFTDHRLVGACATIIANYFVENRIDIPKDVATALLYAIKIDTQNFTSGVTKEDIEAFAMLNPIADQALILRLDSNELEIDDLRAYGAAIQNLYASDGIGFVHIPFDCPDRLIAMVSSFILSLDCVSFSVVYAERNGGMKFSLRSELSNIKAGDLIHIALDGIGDGGGHPLMAGGIIFPEHMSELGKGKKRDEAIRKRFIDAYNRLKAEQST